MYPSLKPDLTENGLFTERISSSTWFNTYTAFNRYKGRPCRISLSRSGRPRSGCRAKQRQQASHFLPRRVHSSMINELLRGEHAWESLRHWNRESTHFQPANDRTKERGVIKANVCGWMEFFECGKNRLTSHSLWLGWSNIKFCTFILCRLYMTA